MNRTEIDEKGDLKIIEEQEELKYEQNKMHLSTQETKMNQTLIKIQTEEENGHYQQTEPYELVLDQQNQEEQKIGFRNKVKSTLKSVFQSKRRNQ